MDDEGRRGGAANSVVVSVIYLMVVLVPLALSVGFGLRTAWRLARTPAVPEPRAARLAAVVAEPVAPRTAVRRPLATHAAHHR